MRQTQELLGKHGKHKTTGWRKVKMKKDWESHNDKRRNNKEVRERKWKMEKGNESKRERRGRGKNTHKERLHKNDQQWLFFLHTNSSLSSSTLTVTSLSSYQQWLPFLHKRILLPKAYLVLGILAVSNMHCQITQHLQLSNQHMHKQTTTTTTTTTTETTTEAAADAETHEF